MRKINERTISPSLLFLQGEHPASSTFPDGATESFFVAALLYLGL